MTKNRWAMLLEVYVKRAIPDIERKLASVGKILPMKARTPISNGYRPELDQSKELNPRRCQLLSGCDWGLALGL